MTRQRHRLRYQYIKTVQERFGCDNVFKYKPFKKRMDKKREETISKRISETVREDGFELLEYGKRELMKLRCLKCENEFDIRKKLYWKRKRYGRSICSCGVLKKGSNSEKKLYDFCVSHIPDFISNDREVLNGYEIDCYSPSLKLGIEFNGLFWHSEKKKSKDYHQHKIIMAENKGIQLVHVWEDDWVS